jgi:serine/threonine-protein kinase
MIGTTLAHFKITGKLGEGGMGEVYRAEDTKLGREVAIKVLPEAFTQDPERLARFEREAQLLASLNHPNIGAIYGLEEADDKRFLVLELIDGDTLQELIRKGVPLERALEMAAQVAGALEEAHEQGIVHRDLKPANVKVTPNGTVKVLDFGLAKAWAPDPSDPRISASPTLTAQMTQAGVILGTAAYMSPEQARGQEVDKRADIWSFGVMVFEMLSGEELFAGDTVTDTLAAVVRAEPDFAGLPKSTPGSARRVLERCLEKDPNLRLRDIGEARIALEGAEPEELSEAPAETIAATPAKFAWLPWVVAAVAVVAGLLAVTGIFPPRSEPTRDVVRFQVEMAPDLDLFLPVGPHLAFSPDGRTVAFVGSQEGREALFARDLESLEAREYSGTDGARGPFFSPDGEWIGYFEGNALRKVSIRGGAPLTLAEDAENARGANWSEDGFIYYAPNTTTGIWKVPAEGGVSEEVTIPSTEEPVERSHRWPQALPDGRSILMTVQPMGVSFDEANLEIFDLETGERTVVHRGGSMGRVLPTGHLVFVREATLYAAPFDMDRREVLRSPAPVIEDVAYGSGHGGAWVVTSEEGTLLQVAGGESFEIPLDFLRVGMDGSEEVLSGSRSAYRNPRMSPDGSAVLYDVSLEGAAPDIWSLDLERDVATRLTFSEAPDFAAVWSPDGGSFAFSSRRSGQANVWLKSAEGTRDAEPLFESSNFQLPSSWHPNGRQLLIHENNSQSGMDLLILDVETKEIEPYLDTEFGEESGDFSPDGRWVAYESDESGEAEVYVRPFPLEAGKWRISSAGGYDPVWAPDGRTIYYRGSDNKVYGVSVAVDGSDLSVGSARALFDDRYEDYRGRSYDIGPDGSFLFMQGEGAAVEKRDFPTVVFNWFEELERLVPLER